MSETNNNLDIDYADDLRLIKLMSEDESFWERIFEAKLDFLNNGTDPRTSPYVRPEIAQSWIDSKAIGPEPDRQILGEYVTDEYVRLALEANKTLIDKTAEKLRSVESLNIENDYIFELMSTEGLSLLQMGSLELHSFAAKKYLLNIGNAGANAHDLCMRYHRPFAVIGPEHYCFGLHELIACAAPILDQYGSPLGALLLTQKIPDRISSAEKKLLIHAMSLVSAIANTISSQLRIEKYQSDLETAEGEYSQANSFAHLFQSLSESLVDITKEATIIINNRLKIVYANHEAAKILLTIPEQLIGKSIRCLCDLGEDEKVRQGFADGKKYTFDVNGLRYSLIPRRILSEESADDANYILLFRKIASKEINSDALKKTVGDTAPITFSQILGRSPQIGRTKKLAHRFAQINENVLITGESGTGKELFAQAIHNVSRPNGPFMSINCAAIPPNLIESELFGYDSGSFTGADKTGKPGKIELANGGTLFLDEIGDMPLELQSTLLRVLENKRIMRVGGKSYKQVDFRLISATNRNLAKMAANGEFREDLLYRLSVLTVGLPPLRNRKGDALFFANYFLGECDSKTSYGKAIFSDEAAAFIDSYDWPGNVRQLKHAIYSAYYTCEKGVIKISDFPAYLTNDEKAVFGHNPASQNDPSSAIKVQNEKELPEATPEHRTVGAHSSARDSLLPTLCLQELERLAISEALKQTGNDIIKASKLLGISKATMYRKLKHS